MRELSRTSTSWIWQVPLRRIDEIVSIHLGPGRVRGNQPEACFSRQVSMYLAHQVGGWSMTIIGKFYNGRHHTTVLHAIRKIEDYRRRDPSIDALLEVLGSALLESRHCEPAAGPGLLKWSETVVDAVASRVIERLTSSRRSTGSGTAASTCMDPSRHVLPP